MILGRGTLEHLRDWRRAQRDVPVLFFRDRLDGLSAFWWALIDGQVAGILWLARRHLFLNTEPDEAILIAGYTYPGYRCKHVFARVIATACGDLVGSYRQAYAVVDIRDAPSSRAFQRAGFRYLGTFAYIPYKWGKRIQRHDFIEAAQKPPVPSRAGNPAVRGATFFARSTRRGPSSHD
jgi:hypothetical protein